MTLQILWLCISLNVPRTPINGEILRIDISGATIDLPISGYNAITHELFCGEMHFVTL